MKRTLLRSLIALVVLLLAYLLLWPVPISPAVWMPPPAPELTGVYAQNSELTKIERLPINGNKPEDVAFDSQDRIYCGDEGGHIYRFQPDGTKPELFGPDDAQTIVVAHGWTEMLVYWAYVIRELSPRFRIVAYDLRGHGESEPAADGDYSIARFGEDLEAVLEASVPEGRHAMLVGLALNRIVEGGDTLSVY